jgi:hypothetical protein
MSGEVLLQVETASHIICRTVTALPVDRTVRITVMTAASAAAATQSDAQMLHSAIANELVALGGRVAMPACGGTYHGTGHCMADGSAPREHNVLVVVEDASCDIDPSIPAAFRRFPSHVIMPVAETGKRALPSASIVRNLMLTYGIGAISRLVAEILLQAGVGTDAFRIFVSYKHDDCARAAQAIFHHLAEARFAVFLDRFCGDPGQNFVARITSELFDKSCLLVLETPNVTGSTWVTTEVATAQTHRLGLLAVDLPGSILAFRIAPRLDCRSVNGGSPLGPSGALALSDLNRIVDFVGDNIAAQGARRRRWQRRNLREAVRRSKITELGETLLGRRLRGSHNIDYHAILSARPPSAPDFKRAKEAGSSEQPILFGPLSHEMASDAALTGWLAGVSDVRAFDEGLMVPTLRDAKRRPL